MSGGRAKLLVLQALVAVVAIGIWYVGSSVPIGGAYLLPKFFFSTPSDVASAGVDAVRRRHRQDRRLHRAASIFPGCSASPTPASARRCGSIC